MPSADITKQAAGIALIGGILSFVWYLQKRKNATFLTKTRKTLKILSVHEESHDTKRIRLSIGGDCSKFGLPVGKHIVIYAPQPLVRHAVGSWNGKEDPEISKLEIERKYTPVAVNDDAGYVDLVIKVYRPGNVKMPDGNTVEWTDGGKLSRYLDGKKKGDTIEINGPAGLIEYLGRGAFKVPGKTVSVRNVGMLAGGTGLTPMLQVVKAALLDTGDETKFFLIYANKTEHDILCRKELDAAAANSRGRFKVTYTLDFPPVGWNGKKGFITQDMIKECLPSQGPETLVLMCGPPPMIEFACKKNLAELGYAKDLAVAF